MLSLATVGGPDRHADKSECSVMHGLTEAVKALCEPTALQQSLDPSILENEPANKGRIVCISSISRYTSVWIGNAECTH